MTFALRLLLAALAVAILLPGAPAKAEYPEKTITYIVPFGAGGGTDRWARIMSSAAFDEWDQAWRVRNVPGASGVVGWKTTLSKPADGYTILQGSPTPVLGLLSEAQPPLNPEKDIKICAYVSAFRSYLLAQPDAPYKTWDEFVKYAKANPKKVTLGATNSHLVGQANVYDQVGIAVTLVSYDGTGKATADFLGKHVSVAAVTGTVATSLAPEKARVIVNTSDLPNPSGFDDQVGGKVPNATELGLSGISFPRWIGVHPDTPDAICKEVSNRIERTVKNKSVARLIKKIGEEVIFVPKEEAQKKYDSMVGAMKKAVSLLK